MDWWIWTLIGFFFLALEFVSTTMHSAFFAAGAFLVAILVAWAWLGESLNAAQLVGAALTLGGIGLAQTAR